MGIIGGPELAEVLNRLLAEHLLSGLLLEQRRVREAGGCRK